MNTTTSIAPVSSTDSHTCSWCECEATHSETYAPCGDGYGSTRTHVDYACLNHAIEYMGVEPPVNPVTAPHTITIRKAGKKPHIILRYSRKGLIERAVEVCNQLGDLPSITARRPLLNDNENGQRLALLTAFYEAL